MQAYYKELVEELLKKQDNNPYINHNMESFPINKKATFSKKNNLNKVKALLLTKNHRDTSITPLQSKL